MRNSPASCPLHDTLSVALLLTLFPIAYPTALAEELTAGQSAGNEQIEEIIVTGSRIKRTEFSSPSPVIVIDMEVAALAGQVDTAEILQGSTIAGNAPQLNLLNIESINRLGGPGTNTIDLRGLGNGKTLVLLNGRRLNPAGTRGTVAAVDLNTIPSSIIQRIEILKDGASSVYGSDAVAGVVNIITKKGADGFSGSLSHSAPFDDGGDVTAADLSVGVSGAGSSFLFGVEYFERQSLPVRDRAWAQCHSQYYRDPATGEDLSLVDPTTGEPKCFDTVAYDYVINYGDYYTTGRPSRSIYDPVLGDWRVGSYAERKTDHPSADHEDIVSPVRRVSAFSFGDWTIDALGGNTEGYYELLYNSRRSDQNFGPRQLGLWLEDSPFSPFYNDGGWANDSSLLIPYEQTGSQDVEWLRSVLGLTGEFADDWSWDFSIGYGHSDGTYSWPQMLGDRVGNMRDVVDLGDGTYDCAANLDPNTAGGGCVPLNPYEIIQNGLNSPDLFPQDILDYMMTVATGETVYRQKSLTAYLTGPLFDLPAGRVEAVFGVEGRRESIDDNPGPDALSNNLWGFRLADITAGTDSVREVFAEIELPLARGMAAARDLTLTAAGRYSSYDTAGSDTTYRVGLNWQIIDQLRLRSSFGTSFRAPSLYENFLNGQVSSLFFHGDPCLEYRETHLPGEPVYENCLTEVGDAGYSVNRTTSLVTDGNAGRIKPETSESLTAGLVLEWATVDLAIALDYFEFTIEGEIGRYGANSIVSQCYNLPPDLFRQPDTICDFVGPRNPNSYLIQEINDSYFNINEKYQAGIDLTIRYAFSIASLDLITDLRATRILDFTEDLFGGIVDDYNGVIGWPKENGQLDLRAMYRDWTFYYGIDYISGQSFYDYIGEDPETSIFVISTKDIAYHDFGIRYGGDGWSVQLGVQNMGNTEPPRVTFPLMGWGNAAANTHYDVLGRKYFLRISKDF